MKTRMIRVLKGLIIFVFVFMILLLFVACNPEARELEDYKKARSTELIDYAHNKGEDNYSPENWQELLRVLEEGLLKIKEATDKETVDSLYYECFVRISRVKKPIQPMSVAEEYAEGCGSEDDPFVILTKGQLIHFSNQVLIGENKEDYFILGADIDLESMEWNPIGLLSYYDRKPGGFSGVFDGNGHEIRNLYISERKINSAAENIGLFGWNEGTIKNLGVVGININIRWGPIYGVGMSAWVGGLTGMNGGDIINCYTQGNIKLKYLGKVTGVSPNHIRAGGLVGGYSEGNVKNCYSMVNMDVEYRGEPGTMTVSWLAAGGFVENSFIAGNMDAEFDYYGRVGGNDYKLYRFGTERKNCYAYEGIMLNGKPLQGDSSLCSKDELNTASFYIEKLGWDESVWDFDNLDFDEGFLPKLRKIKDVPFLVNKR